MGYKRNYWFLQRSYAIERKERAKIKFIAENIR